MRLRLILIVALALLTLAKCLEVDYYKLLGLERDADNREIRKAFKKLALKMHPDKNAEDPEAHDKFVKLNRAYEVLKDEDLRKKYDEFGEKGLSDDFKNPRYESWKFYQQNFGIYDDDEEIITLSRGDFEQSVENSGDIWFINYYSAHCGHCHELAPTWREVARQLEGVVRIGAVNCEDDWMLCRQQGIRSYPSLVLYPKAQKYQGSRTVEVLVQAAMQELTVKTFTVTEANLESLTSANQNPWLITFCTNHGGDCLDTIALIKVAAILESLANVGMVDCIKVDSLCDKLNVETSETNLYLKLPVGHSNNIKLDELAPKEIAMAVLHHLPEVSPLDSEALLDIRGDLTSGDKATPWLLHFIQNPRENVQIDLRRLPAMLSSYIHVGKVDCSKSKDVCSEFHIHKYPTFIIVKPGGGFEVHHGRVGAHDIATFARECSTTTVRALSPDDFPGNVQTSGDLWIVDFFAPWCPPCMRLLPEFRKASKLTQIGVNFGTVDCTVHPQLCNSLNIHSYPTTILYNDSIPHQFRGNHDASSIIEFIHDILNPPVIILSNTDFEQKILGKSSKELWIVDFYTPWCGPCMSMMSEWRRFAKQLKDKTDVYVASIDCQTHTDACNKIHLQHYPTIRVFPFGSVGTSNQAEFTGFYRNAQSFMTWAQDFLPSKVTVLTSQNFQQLVLNSQVPWVVDFYANWCGPCQRFASEFEQVAEEFEGKLIFGKIDCARHSYACQQAYIQSYPSLRFYPGVAKGQQAWFGEPVQYTGAAYHTSQDLKSKLRSHKLIEHDEL